jgi:hypothetical protein
MSRKLKFYYNPTRITSTSHEVHYTFMITSRSILRMRKFSHKSCRENQNTHVMFNKFFSPRKSCRLLDNVEKYCRAGEATSGNITHALCMLGN